MRELKRSTVKKKKKRVGHDVIYSSRKWSHYIL